MGASAADQARMDELRAADAAEAAAEAAASPSPAPSVQLAAPLAFTPTTSAPSVSPADQARMDELRAADAAEARVAPASLPPGLAEIGAVPTAGASVAPGVAALNAFAAGDSVNRNVPDPVRNEEHEKLPDWTRAPEVQNLLRTAAHDTVLAQIAPWTVKDITSAAQLAALSSSDAEQTSKILKKKFPSLDIRQSGDYLLMESGQDGQTYAWKPGVRGSDLARTAARMIAMAPLTLLGPAGLLGQVATSAGEQALIEAAQKRSGGDFHPGQVALAGALPLLGAAVKGAAGMVMGKGAQAAEQAGAGAAANDISASAAFEPGASAPAPGAPPRMTEQELGAQMAKAARGNTSAARKVAAQVSPNPETVAAVKRQGLLSQVHPDQLSTNRAYQGLSQEIPGAAERHAATLAAVQNNLEKLVSTAGGDADQSMLHATIKSGLQNQRAANTAQTRALYDALNAAVPENAPTPATGLIAEIDRRLANKRNASPALEKLRAAVSPRDGVQPTWSDIDDITKDLGNPMGSYKKLPSGLAKKLYPFLDADRLATAEKFGAGEILKSAKVAYMAADAFDEAASEAFGEEAGKALERLGSSVKSLATGNAEPFVKIITAAPEALRSKIAESSLLSIFSKDVKPEWAVKWFDNLERNNASRTALMTYLSPATRQGLKDSVEIIRSVLGAASQRASAGGKAAFPEGGDLAKKVFEYAVSGGAGIATHAAGAPAASVPVSMFVKWAISGERAPILDAMKELVTSPAGRLALKHAVSGEPLPAAAFASVRSAFSRFSSAANLPASQQQKLIESALRVGSTMAPRSGAPKKEQQ